MLQTTSVHLKLEKLSSYIESLCETYYSYGFTKNWCNPVLI